MRQAPPQMQILLRMLSNMACSTFMIRRLPKHSICLLLDPQSTLTGVKWQPTSSRSWEAIRWSALRLLRASLSPIACRPIKEGPRASALRALDLGSSAKPDPQGVLTPRNFAPVAAHMTSQGTSH